MQILQDESEMTHLVSPSVMQDGTCFLRHETKYAEGVSQNSLNRRVLCLFTFCSSAAHWQLRVHCMASVVIGGVMCVVHLTSI